MRSSGSLHRGLLIEIIDNFSSSFINMYSYPVRCIHTMHEKERVQQQGLQLQISEPSVGTAVSIRFTVNNLLLRRGTTPGGETFPVRSWSNSRERNLKITPGGSCDSWRQPRPRVEEGRRRRGRGGPAWPVVPRTDNFRIRTKRCGSDRRARPRAR